MVEIAEATIPDGHPLRVLVLDEPTSALGSEPAHQLFEFLREMQRNEQLSVILISHRLPEILGNTDRVAVMRDGLVVGMLTTGEATTNQVLGLMGAVGAEASSQGKQRDHRAATSDGEPIVALHEHTTRALRGISLEIRAGEIVGLAGLEGEGQHELLLTIWRGSRRRLARRGVSVACEVGYVTGDRQNAGVFPLWSVAENVSVNSLRQLAKWGIISGSAERRLVGEWAQRLGVTGSPKRGIGELSGGNQQKTLLARVLASDAKVVLLDDPFRGVDVLTKRQAYAHMREQAREGRAFVWFSTENIELLECDRVEVLRRGQIITELQGEELTTERILAASFAEPATEVQGHGRGD
jgi:ribose transport system ATP-binding protein